MRVFFCKIIEVVLVNSPFLVSLFHVFYSIMALKGHDLMMVCSKICSNGFLMDLTVLCHCASASSERQLAL